MSNGAIPPHGYKVTFVGGEGTAEAEQGWFELWPQVDAEPGGPPSVRRADELFPLTDTGDEFELRPVDWWPAPFAPVLGSGLWPRPAAGPAGDPAADPDAVLRRRLALWGAVGDPKSGRVRPDRLPVLLAHYDDAVEGTRRALALLKQVRAAQRAILLAVGRAVQGARHPDAVRVQCIRDLQRWWARLTDTAPTGGPGAGGRQGPVPVSAEEVRESFEQVLAGWTNVAVQGDRLPGGPPAGLSYYQEEWYSHLATARTFEGQMLDTVALLGAHRAGERAPTAFLSHVGVLPATADPSDLLRDLVEMVTLLLIRHTAGERPPHVLTFKVHPARVSGPAGRYVEIGPWASLAQVLRKVDRQRSAAAETTYRYFRERATAEGGLPDWMGMGEWTTDLTAWYAVASRTADAMVGSGRATTVV